MKHLLSVLLGFSLIMSQLSSAMPTKAENEKIFADVRSEDAYSDSILYLKNKAIVNGYQGGSFRPDYSINRAELTKIVVGAAFKPDEIAKCKSSAFPDVKKDDWFSSYVCVATQKGIVKGYSDGTFKPAQAVNFAEASKIISSISSPLPRGDRGGSGGPWYEYFVKTLATRHAIPPSIRSFGKRITRAEMARMIHASKEKVNETSLTFAQITKLNEKDADLPQVDSCDALIEKLKLDEELPIIRTLDAFGAPGAALRDQNVVAPMAAGASQNKAESSASEDFSKTNVQVAGVDEADIVKNDGKYIYLIKGQTVRIVEAFPAETMREVSKIDLGDSGFQPQEIYTDEDQMVIIGETSGMTISNRMSGIMKPQIYPGPIFGSNRTKIFVYSIADRKHPIKQRTLEIEGSYSSSRKVGKNVYFVLNQYIPTYHILEGQSADVIIPKLKDSAKGGEEKPMVRCMDILSFPNTQDRSYLVVAGLNIADEKSELKRKVIIGASQNVYASANNLYVANVAYGENSGEPSTTVYRFSLAEDSIEYETKGSVPGSILNQFSMDESGNDFRIATERQTLLAPYTSTNGLFILKSADMSVQGKVGNIAPGEHIKSVRFMGNRAYLVTFKNVDPLFVIDVSDASDPKILGQLKIPGWSDYLHPYDETHLIGFGRDVDASIDADKVHSDNAVYYTALLGMKLSLFDVSDVANPTEMFHEVIGTRGTTSELLTNHKALLFDKERGLIGFPISITEAKSPSASPEAQNIQTVFQGGIFYTLDLTNGFKLVGKVTHYDNLDAFKASGEYFYGDSGRNIQRVISIGDSLYGVSPDIVSASKRSDLSLIKKIELLPKMEGGGGIKYMPME